MKKKGKRNKNKKKANHASDPVDPNSGEKEDLLKQRVTNTDKFNAIPANPDPKTRSTPNSPNPTPENSSELTEAKSAPLPETHGAGADESERVKVNATTIRVGRLDIFIDKALLSLNFL